MYSYINGSASSDYFGLCTKPRAICKSIYGFPFTKMSLFFFSAKKNNDTNMWGEIILLENKIEMNNRCTVNVSF